MLGGLDCTSNYVTIIADLIKWVYTLPPNGPSRLRLRLKYVPHCFRGEHPFCALVRTADRSNCIPPTFPPGEAHHPEYITTDCLSDAFAEHEPDNIAFSKYWFVTDRAVTSDKVLSVTPK